MQVALYKDNQWKVLAFKNVIILVHYGILLTSIVTVVINANDRDTRAFQNRTFKKRNDENNTTNEIKSNMKDLKRIILF